MKQKNFKPLRLEDILPTKKEQEDYKNLMKESIKKRKRKVREYEEELTRKFLKE